MISVLIISKNAEDMIGDAIKSTEGFADEVVVVDDSDDQTSIIAEKLGARVFRNKFKDFSSQRNLALSLARGDWILYLDSDERLTPDFIKEASQTILNFDPKEEIAGYLIKRKTFFYNRDWGFSDKVQRLFYKEKLKGWKGSVHESAEVEGRLLEIKSPILHYTHRNLSNMVEKTNEWSEFEADLRFKASHPKMNAIRFFRVMITGFLKSYFGEKGYRNGVEGVIESLYQSFSMFITYAKLWEKQNRKK